LALRAPAAEVVLQDQDFHCPAAGRAEGWPVTV
jgi:hypothetical protein